MNGLRLLVSAIVMLAATACATAQSGPPQATWVNDHGSTLVIQSVAPDGKLTGTSSNSQPDFKCRGVAFPLAGWMDGDRISYTVRWSNAAIDCASTTSWSGYISGGVLLANWTIVYRDSDGQTKNRTGSDRYTQR